MTLRDLVWLATSELPRLGHTVVSEQDTFPLADPMHVEPEIASDGIDTPVDLDKYGTELTALAPRVALLYGDDQFPGDFDPATIEVLLNIRDQARAAIDSPGARLALFLAYSAADKSLRHPKDNPKRTTGVARRFGFFCGADDEESARLEQTFNRLDPIRDEISHGGDPTPAGLDRLVEVSGRSVVSYVQALPAYMQEQQRIRHARAIAIELIRRLVRSWLMVTIRSADGTPQPGLRQDEVVALARDAAGDLRRARAALRDAQSIIAK